MSRRPKHQRRLHATVLSLVAALCLTASGPLTVRAADIVTTTTLDSYPTTVWPDQAAAYTAHIWPIPDVSDWIYFEYSADGVTWTQIGGGPIDASGYTSINYQNDAHKPKGPRFVRAHYLGFQDWLESSSAPVAQTNAAFVTSIDAFTVTNENGTAIWPGSPDILLHADITNRGGTLYLERQTDTGWIELDSVFLDTHRSNGATNVHIGALGAGDHVLRARVSGNDYVTGAVRETTVHVTKATPNLTIESLVGPPVANHPFRLAAFMGVNLGSDLTPTGTVTIRNVMTDEIVGTTTWAAGLQFELPALAAGTITLQSSYAGDPNVLPGVSEPTTFTILPDTVQASAVRLDLTTFYPYKDGYRDSVVASGVREETSSVAIRIYGPTGKLVKSGAIASGIGAYAFPWTGRTSTGAILANGKYKVVQTLTDAAGTPRSVASYVNLSSKRLYTYSTYLNKTLSQAAKRTSSWIGWEFYLPSATVYSSLRFEAYARSDGLPGLSMGGQDFRLCPSRATWSTSCVGSWTNVKTTTSWTAKSLFTTHERSGRYVRGIVAAFGSGVVYKARLYVVYKVLK